MGDRHEPDPMAQDREINCPSAGRYVSAYREIGMSASNGTDSHRWTFDKTYRLIPKSRKYHWCQPPNTPGQDCEVA